MTKVASITKIYNESRFMEWLDNLPYHTPWQRRNWLWNRAKEYQVCIWIQDIKGGEEFFFH